MCRWKAVGTVCLASSFMATQYTYKCIYPFLNFHITAIPMTWFCPRGCNYLYVRKEVLIFFKSGLYFHISYYILFWMILIHFLACCLSITLGSDIKFWHYCKTFPFYHHHKKANLAQFWLSLLYGNSTAFCVHVTYSFSE